MQPVNLDLFTRSIVYLLDYSFKQSNTITSLIIVEITSPD